MQKQNGLENSHKNKIRQAQVKQSSAYLQIPKSNTVGRPKMTYDNSHSAKKPVTNKDLPSGVINRSKTDTPSYRISIMQNGVKMTAKTKNYEEKFANPLKAAERGYVDDIIMPADTRARIVNALHVLENKQSEKQNRRHDNLPL